MLGGRWTAPAALALVLAIPAPAHAAADRAALARHLRAPAGVDVDARTGTPRVLAKLDGALSAPASGDPKTIADAYVRSHLSDLGLDSGDLATLGTATTE